MAAGDKSDHRFVDLSLLEERGGLFFLPAAHFADQYDGFGLRILGKKGQAIRKAKAVNRVAANSDGG